MFTLKRSQKDLDLPLHQVQNRQFSIFLIREDRKSVVFTGKVSFLTMVLSRSKTVDRQDKKCLLWKALKFLSNRLWILGMFTLKRSHKYLDCH